MFGIAVELMVNSASTFNRNLEPLSRTARDSVFSMGVEVGQTVRILVEFEHLHAHPSIQVIQRLRE